MLRCQCPSVCPSCLSVTFVHCGHRVQWIPDTFTCLDRCLCFLLTMPHPDHRMGWCRDFWWKRGGSSRAIIATARPLVCLGYFKHACWWWWWTKFMRRMTLLLCQTASSSCKVTTYSRLLLRKLACNVGSHSITYYPAEVALSPLPQPDVLDLVTLEGWKVKLTSFAWLHTCVVYRPIPNRQ